MPCFYAYLSPSLCFWHSVSVEQFVMLSRLLCLIVIWFYISMLFDESKGGGK